MKIIVLHGDDTAKSYARLTKFIDTAKSRNWEILYDQVVPTSSLFGQERLIILKDYKLFSPKLKFNGTLVIYHEGNLSAAFLKSLSPNTKLERYDLPQLLWSFLNKPTVRTLHEVSKNNAIEFVFIMLYRNLKKKKRYDLVTKMAQIDIDYKTGKVDLPLALDLFISKHLE